MTLKSLVLALSLVFLNTGVWAQPKNILPALEATFTEKVARAVRTGTRVPCSVGITPGNIKNIAPYTPPRQCFTVLGHISNGIFVMNPYRDTPRIIPEFYRSRTGCSMRMFLLGEREKELLKSEFEGFRGMTLKNLVDLENLLDKGSEVNKTHYSRIHFSDELEIAIDYLFPQYRYPVISVLITFKEYRYDSYGMSYQDIPAKDQEVFAYLHHNGKDGWYHVSLSGGNIIAIPLEVYLAKQKPAEQATNNPAGNVTDLDESVPPNP